jgi:hypothetical protein
MIGWVKVVDVDYSQMINVKSSCDSDVVYRIKHRMQSDSSGEEYLLIENRGACGYDLKLKDGDVDRQGIVIWHVDHTKLLGELQGKDTIRYDTQKPPSDPAWPGIHSRVSVLPADGQFELETNKNRGNEWDAFRKHPLAPLAAHTISNSGIILNNGNTLPYPNTNSIANGVEIDTGIKIEVMSSASYTIPVKVTLTDESGNVILTSPTAPPTDPPTYAPTLPPTDPPTAPPTAGPTPLQATAAPTIIATPVPTAAATAAPTVAATSPPTSPPTSGSLLGGGGTESGTLGGTAAGDGNPTTNIGTTAAPTTPTSTVPPTEASESSFACDNSESVQFTVSGVGADPIATIHRECKFISNKPDEREAEFCNADDISSATGTDKVYMKCQKECPTYTGC